MSAGPGRTTYRVRWRRGPKFHHATRANFETAGAARRFVEKLNESAIRRDLPPPTVAFDSRMCGPWTEIEALPTEEQS